MIESVEEAKTLMQQFLADTKQAQSEAQAKIDAQETQLQTTLTQYQSTFDTQQQDRANQFAKELDDQRTKAKATIDELTTETSASTEAALEDAAAKTRELDKQLGQAKNIVGLIAQTSMSGHYQQFANSEEKSASHWRWTTVGIGSVFVAALGALVGYEEVTKTKVVTNPSKITLSIALFALASYCASQAAAHQRAGRHARSLELALKSLPAYLQEVTDETARQKALETFGYYFFGREIPHTAGEEQFQATPQGWAQKFAARWFTKSPPP